MQEQSTLFSEDSLARTYLSQDGEPGSRASAAAYGLKCSELLRHVDPVLWLLRTSVERSISPSIPCALEWRRGDTASGLSSFQLLHSALRTNAKGFLSSESAKMWPTPVKSDYRGPALNRTKRHRNPLTNNLRDAVRAVSEITERSGQLNPDWVEELMGFLEGWTNPDVDEPQPWQGWPAPMGAQLWLSRFARTGKSLRTDISDIKHGLVFDQYPYEFPRTVKGGKHRAARIKALGNAVVPQQAYPFFRAIAEMDSLIKEDELP